jgi:outer membrane translocation and assembly module TamA
MYYASVEYAYSGLAVFLDVGSVWDRPGDHHARVSTGLGFYAGPVFATIGFPLNTDKVSAVFTMGLRISETKLRW